MPLEEYAESIEMPALPDLNDAVVYVWLEYGVLSKTFNKRVPAGFDTAIRATSRDYNLTQFACSRRIQTATEFGFECLNSAVSFARNLEPKANLLHRRNIDSAVYHG